MTVEVLVFPVPFAEVEVTFVGVTTMTFEDKAVLDVVVEVVLVLTGPLTPEVLVVVAFVVEVDPLTTETGPLTPEVPMVSAALDETGKKRAVDNAMTSDGFNRDWLHMNKGSRAETSRSNVGLGLPNLFAP